VAAVTDCQQYLQMLEGWVSTHGWKDRMVPHLCRGAGVPQERRDSKLSHIQKRPPLHISDCPWTLPCTCQVLGTKISVTSHFCSWILLRISMFTSGISTILFFIPIYICIFFSYLYIYIMVKADFQIPNSDSNVCRSLQAMPPSLYKQLD